MSILDEIFAHKIAEVADRKIARPLASVRREAGLAPRVPDFLGAIGASASAGDSRNRTPALIAEVKRASPSQGFIASEVDPIEHAARYRQNGAAAVSVLTDYHYFRGSMQDLSAIARAFPDVPLLQKDFIFDPYQVYEARAAGAAAVLLIVAALDPLQLQSLHRLIRAVGMTPLVEVHDEEQLASAMRCEPVLIGINNRNLHDFSVDLQTTLRLRPHVPPGVMVVAESGIQTPRDVQMLGRAGVDAILVGEALMTAADIEAHVHSFVHPGRRNADHEARAP